MKPIRILQVLTIMNRGGAETMIMNYYRNIDRSKVQFDFLLHRKEEGVFDKEIISLGGKIHRLSNISFANLRAYKKSLNIFFKENKEYKIVHSHLNALSVFVLKAAKKNNVPVRIAHSHTSQFNLNINPFSNKRDSKEFILKFIVQNIFKNGITNFATDYFSCGSKAGLWLFGKKNLPKVKLINNAIDVSQYTYNKTIAEEYKKKLELDDKLIIGHVGNFVQEKNHEFILHVFKEIKTIKTSCKLILVGGGKRDYFENLSKDLKINDSVQFLGVRSDVDRILQAIDVFIFPSTNEGLPVTLIEAQAAGLKIFASDDVSNELNITGLVNFVSLKNKHQYWANLILDSIPYIRENMKSKIQEGGYDIITNALMLQKFYLKTNNNS